MKTIMKEVAILLSFLIGGIVMFVFITIELAFKLVRTIRFIFLKSLSLMFRSKYVDEHNAFNWNKFAVALSISDIEYATSQMTKISVRPKETES